MIAFSNIILKKSDKEAKHCAMGACKTPITWESAVSMRRRYTKKGLHREECTAQPEQQKCTARA
jgi:hypothetical protein